MGNHQYGKCYHISCLLKSAHMHVQIFIFRIMHMHVLIFIALLNVLSVQNQHVPSGNQCNRKFQSDIETILIVTWTTKLRLSQSKNMLKWKSTLDKILSLTVEKLIWSLEVNRSTSLNQRQAKRLLIGTCSRTITHPSGTSAAFETSF